MILSAFTILFVLATAIFAGRRKGVDDRAAKAVDEWRQEAEAIRSRADRLHDDLREERKNSHQLQQQIINLETQIVRLESLPDLSQLLTEMTKQREWGEKRTLDSVKMVTQMFDKHESRAAERHEATIESFARLNEGLTAINVSLRATNGHGGA